MSSAERSRVLRFVVVLGFGTIMVAALWSCAPKRPGAYRVVVYPRTLPPGPGRDRVGAGCLVCHSATLITQQHKDSAAWERTLAQMEKWGAPVAPSLHDSVRMYLVAHFGPRRRNAP